MVVCKLEASLVYTVGPRATQHSWPYVDLCPSSMLGCVSVTSLPLLSFVYVYRETLSQNKIKKYAKPNLVLGYYTVSGNYKKDKY